jgi:hypothetical protein
MGIVNAYAHHVKEPVKVGEEEFHTLYFNEAWDLKELCACPLMNDALHFGFTSIYEPPPNDCYYLLEQAISTQSPQI